MPSQPSVPGHQVKAFQLDDGWILLNKHPHVIKPLPFPPRPCPVCQSTLSKLLFEQRFGTLSEGSLLAGYDVVVCAACGCAFADRIPEQSVFDEHYSRMSKYEYTHRGGEESPYDGGRFDIIAKYLSEQIENRETRILDVGCATGGLLDRLRLLGYANVTGLDPSAGCAELAKQCYDLSVHIGTAFENDLPKRSYDLVIVVGVLEHIRNVSAAVAKLDELVSPAGLIFAEVPDATAFSEWPDAPYQEFSIEHVNFFGPASLENLMKAAGYTLVKMDRPPRQFTRTTVMPSAAGLFRRTSEQSLPVSHDRESEPALRAYLAQSVEEEKRISGKIAGLIQARQEMAVWGVGTHTLHLMESTSLADAHITVFVDVNSKYHGKELFGRPVISPREMAARPEPILVSSRAFQSDIVNTIRNEALLGNPLILLYPQEG
jgi:SAM-dependent methyltransferase